MSFSVHSNPSRMAPRRKKRKGKMMERHPTKVAGETNDKASTEGFLVKSGGGASAVISERPDSVLKLELMIGEMAISINAEPNPPREGGTTTGEAEEGKPVNFPKRNGIEPRHRYLQQSGASLDTLKCCCCSKSWSCEPSSTHQPYRTETCHHEFCSDCYRNIIKGSLLRLSLKSTTLEDVTSALQCPVVNCQQQFTYLDIKRALGSDGLHHFQDVMVGLFSRMFGASWRKKCSQCGTHTVQASLVRAPDLENLSLAEVYRAMEARGLPVSGRSKEQGIQDLESVTRALVSSPWRLICLACNCVQCDSCGLQIVGPTNSTVKKAAPLDCTIEDFGIILQGRELTYTPEMKVDREDVTRSAPFSGIAHTHCEVGRKQCYTLYSAAMEIATFQNGNENVLSMVTHAKDAAIWPVDAQQLRSSSSVYSNNSSHPVKSTPNMVTDAGICPSSGSAGLVESQTVPVGDMLRMLLPSVKSVLPTGNSSSNEQGLVMPAIREFGGPGPHMMPAISNEVLYSSAGAPLSSMGFMNMGSIIPGGVNLHEYWKIKAGSWMQLSDYWFAESERFADASEWWDEQMQKYMGRSENMTRIAEKWLNNETYWSRSTERVAAANKLWGYKIQEMSQLCSSKSDSGLSVDLEKIESSASVPPTLPVVNVSAKSDAEDYTDSLGADTEWRSPVEFEVERWSTASNVSVPSSSLDSSPNARGSSAFGVDFADSFAETDKVPSDKITDEKLMNAFWDLSEYLEVNAAVGINLCAPAGYFLWAFGPLRAILYSLLQNESLIDVMSRETLYTEVFYLLLAISNHKNVLPVLCIPSRVGTAESSKTGSLFEALKGLHQKAEDMLSEALVKVENDHEATQKNVYLIGDMEDAFEIVQSRLIPSFSSWMVG